MKKLKYGILCLLMMMCVSCGNSKIKDSTFLNTSLNSEEVSVDNSKETSTLEDEVVSSMITLNYASLNQTLGKQDIQSENLDKIEELLPTIDLFIHNTSFESIVEESNKEGYTYKQTIQYINFDLTTKNMNLYYNVTKQMSDSSYDEEETISLLEGIIEEENQTYLFSGINKIEPEDNEKEEELELKIYPNSEDKTSFIYVSQEVEKESDEIEEEYQYEIRKNNQLISSFEIEKEKKALNDEEKVKLIFNGTKYSFKEYTNNNSTYIDVKVAGSTSLNKVTYERIIIEGNNGNQIIQFIRQ